MYCQSIRYTSRYRFPESFKRFWDLAKNGQNREKCMGYSPCILLNFGQFCSFLAKAQNALKLSGNLPRGTAKVFAIHLSDVALTAQQLWRSAFIFTITPFWLLCGTSELLSFKSYIRQMYCQSIRYTSRKVSWEFQKILRFGQKWPKSRKMHGL